MFLARLDALRGIGEFVEGYCRQESIGRATALRLNLVLEELFVNSIRHGYRGDCDEPVWVTLEAKPRAVQLTYEDTGPPFNPYAHLPATTAERSAGQKIGGLGVLLTQELAASRDYAYVFGRNRIRLALTR
jgi:anti-sigma regulatory factor (Ser/Thr protein kinase)